MLITAALTLASATLPASELAPAHASAPVNAPAPAPVGSCQGLLSWTPSQTGRVHSWKVLISELNTIPALLYNSCLSNFLFPLVLC